MNLTEILLAVCALGIWAVAFILAHGLYFNRAKEDGDY